jgi:hypothetical protein
MIYLISQLWPWMLVAAIVGGAIGWRLAACAREQA